MNCNTTHYRANSSSVPGDPTAKLQALLSDPANLPYLHLGCQGPDFLLFNTKDIDPALKDLVQTYFDVYDFIERFKRDLIKLVPQPVLDALAAFDEAANAVVTSSSTLTELQELFEDMQQVIDALSAVLLEAVKRFLTEFNLFDVMSHPYRDGVPKGAKPAGFNVGTARGGGARGWWWFDAMHYRKTGKVAADMLASTKPDSPLHLYAIGYLSHVAADTVGHPYVNAISGGPYRSHAQRHKGSENYQDVFNFLGVRGADWNFSALHALYNFNYTGTIDTANDVPDPFTHLPPDLADLIANTLNSVYEEDGAPPSPEYATSVTGADIDAAYRLWYAWFKNATETGTLPPPWTYSLSAELREVWDQAMDNLGDIGDFIEDAADAAGDMGIWGIFLLLGALILGALAAAAAVIDAVLGALTTLGSATIRWAACLIYEQLYNAFETFRLGVAMNGLAFPMQQHLTDPRITHWANPSLPDAVGNDVSFVLGRLPALKWVTGVLHNERHLTYPPTAQEQPGVFSVPANYLDKASTWYGWGDIVQQPKILDELLALTPSANPAGNDDGTKLGAIYNDKRLLGNAVELTQTLYDALKAGGPIPDFNLDGDRCYGALCWVQQTDPAPDFPDPVTTPVNLNFIR